MLVTKFLRLDKVQENKQIRYTDNYTTHTHTHAKDENQKDGAYDNKYVFYNHACPWVYPCPYLAAGPHMLVFL